MKHLLSKITIKVSTLFVECNTILIAYTSYRHLEYYCTHPSINSVFYNDLKLLVCSRQSSVRLSSLFNPLPDIPILDSSNSAANKDMIRKNMDKWRCNYLIE